MRHSTTPPDEGQRRMGFVLRAARQPRRPTGQKAGPWAAPPPAPGVRIAAIPPSVPTVFRRSLF